MKTRLYLLCLTGPLLSMALSAPAGAADFGLPFIEESTWRTPFNKIAQVACHNCYEKQYAKTFTSVFDSIRTVELDIWDQRDAASGGSAKHWFVRHNAGTLFQSGNDNNCTGDGTGKNDLEACLKDIKTWSDANAPHFPITIVIDKKQGWSKDSSQRTPKDFDELLVKIFMSTLFTPQDLAKYTGAGSPLQTNITGKDWPTATELAGKVIVVLNHTENQQLSGYVDARGAEAKAFVAPVTNGQNDITGVVSGMSRSASNWVVMNNMGSGDKAWAQHVNASTHIGRVYGDDKVSFAQHVAERVHLSAYYDFVNAKDSNGYRIRPF